MKETISKVFEMFNENSESIYCVGGSVRDHLLGIESNDFDFCTSAVPQKIIEILESNYLPVYRIGEKYGTIGTFFDSKKIEITTYRKEKYKPKDRNPEVSFGKSLKEDLQRRDFCFNAMAMDKDGNIIDPFNGQADIKNKLIKTPQRECVSFQDDPLRMLRACRFAAKLNFKLTLSTFTAIKVYATEINNISVERVFEEMTKLLLLPNPTVGLEIMAETGLLTQIMPEFKSTIEFKNDQGKYHSKNVWQHILGVVKNAPQILELRWSALMHDSGKPECYSVVDDCVHFYGHEVESSIKWRKIAERLKVGNQIKDDVYFYVLNHMKVCTLSKQNIKNSTLRVFINKCGDKLNNLFELSYADITSHNPKIVEEDLRITYAFRKRIDDIVGQEDPRNIKLPKGLGLKIIEEIGIPPAGWVSEVMSRLHSKLVDGTITLDSDLVKEARTIFEEIYTYEHI